MVTFPFLFGLMFGDIGHGTLLLLFAVYVCLNADGIEKTMPSLKVFVKIRYLLLLLGFFALYAGFIYNDMLSLPLDLFGSCFATIDNHTSVVNLPDCIYPFGFDPKWYVSSNEISFFNSFKMKYAVIIGVAQMSLGVCMKGLNAVHNKSKIDFFFEFLP
jgi:V-type H+-transporting ATPase subunit a